MVVAIVLIAVGGAAVIAGELLGVWSKQRGDTVTDWVVWIRDHTRVHGFPVFLIPVLAGDGWLAYHFLVAT